MNCEFELAVSMYYKIVKDLCLSLINNINKTENILIHDKFELYSYFRKKKQTIFYVCGKRYVLHGSGMTVFFNNKIVADWDFGYRNLWCGIDPFKMAITLKNFNFKIADFYDGIYINEICKEYYSTNDLILHGNQFYINYLNKGTKKIDFPSYFDTLIIKYNGKEKAFKASKIINKFIRKANEIYKDIEKLDDSFELLFIHDNNEVSRILYNDFAYPKSAVEILYHQILRPYDVDEVDL